MRTSQRWRVGRSQPRLAALSLASLASLAPLASVAILVLLGLLNVMAVPTRGATRVGSAGTQVSVTALPPAGADALVVMDDDVPRAQIDGVRRALRRDDSVERFSVFDQKAIRRQVERLRRGTTAADQPTKEEPLPSFLVVQLRPDAHAAAWSRRVERLPGVRAAVGASDGAPDVIEFYASCLTNTAHGWTNQIFMSIDATPDQITAVRAALDGDAGVANVEFVDQEAAYTEFQRIFRTKPDLLRSITAADLPTSFRLTIDRDSRQSATDVLKSMPGVDQVTDLPIGACAASSTGFG